MAHGSVGGYGKESLAAPLGIDPENLRLQLIFETCRSIKYCELTLETR